MKSTRLQSGKLASLVKRCRAICASRQGMTLGEVLVAVVIMSLATAGLATGVAFGVKQFNMSMQTSAAQQLFSSLEVIIDSNLRYADDTDYDTSGNVEWFGNNASHQIFQVNDSGQIVLVTKNPSSGATESTENLVGSKEYAHDLKASISSLKYSAATGYFTYKLTIYDSDGNALISENIKVRAMNVNAKQS